MMTGSFTKSIAAPGRLPPATRVYAVGDVHGCSTRLAALHRWIGDDLARAPIDHPVLIHLGDYIDRGPDSAGVIAQLMARPLPGLAMVNLRGNHEQMLLDALADPDAAPQWLANHGDGTLAGWGISPSDPPDTWAGHLPPGVLDFLAALPLTHRVGDYLFVHAGLRPGIALPQQVPADLLWIREDFLDWSGHLVPDAPDLVAVHGHTPRRAPVIRRNRIGVDTGAVKGGALSCAVLEGRRLRFLNA